MVLWIVLGVFLVGLIVWMLRTNQKDLHEVYKELELDQQQDKEQDK
ncbi:MAG: hypothetical protein HQL58_05880 [Magnetococcales bacterium]|nr:hypothetical protein [Magnetococcales bacterium]